MKKKYVRNIIFSKTPLKGHFRFNEEFQIFPCDFANAPKSKYASDFPLVIEFWIDEEENPEVPAEFDPISSLISSSTNKTNKLSRLTRLLSTLTNHRIDNPTNPEFKWGIPVPDDLEKDAEQIDNSSSTLIMEAYNYPSISTDLKIEGFSKQQHPSIEMVPHRVYYQYDPVDSRDKEITFPHTIHRSLTKYFSLDSKSRKIVDTICHLICNGIDIKSKMKSISFLSFVSSIETLVNFEFKDKKDGIEFECHDCQTLKSSSIHCKKCGRPIWGVKAKFKSFLKTYVAHSEDSLAKFNRIYNLRSSIVHSGMLLLGDEEMDWNWSVKAESQAMTHLETMQLSRLAIVNWLLMGPNKQIVE